MFTDSILTINISFEGEAFNSLAGFTIPEANKIPYGDAYNQIGTSEQINSVCQESVGLITLQIHIPNCWYDNWMDG